jgi:opacity protein-like surface antigen
MKKLALAAAIAAGLSAPAFAADYIPAPAPTCHETYGVFAIFHCWHEGWLFHHTAPAPVRG